MEQQHLALYDTEWMKMAMLKHDEVFKQQVYELHRLYRTQKMLMKKTSLGDPGGIPKTDHPLRNDKHPRPSEYCFTRKQARMLVHFDHDNEAIDLTLGLGTYNCHSERSSKSPTRLSSDSVMSFSSSSTGSNSHYLKKKASAAGRNNDEVYQEQYYRLQDQAMEQPQWLSQSLGSEHMSWNGSLFFRFS